MSDTTPQRISLDALSPLSHKQLIGPPWHQPHVNTGPSWVPPHERRRLNGYITRAAYVDCVARLLLPVDVPDHVRNRHREYGDVASFVDRVVASVLGDDWQIVVDGADDDLDDGPDLDDRPGDPAAGPDGKPDPLQARIATIRQKAWDAQAEALVTAWEEALAAQPVARARQTQLREWAEQAHLAARIHEGEHDVAALADGIYVLWPQAGDWPTVEVFDPGMYFPELGTVVRGEFPDEIHIAWDFDKFDDAGVRSRWVRRLSFQLLPISDLRTVTSRRGVTSWIGLDGEPLPNGEGPFLLDGETVDPDGTIHRRLPWHVDGQPGATVTCVFSDGEWPLDAVTAGKTWALDPAEARWNTLRQDWGVDFLPVIHVPNTPTGKEHFGRGIFDRQAQLLDDIAQIDGRVMNGSQYLGSPTLGLEGASLPDETPERGSVWRRDRGVTPPTATVAPGKILTGKITAIDMSGGIEKLLAFDAALRDRFLENVGAPAELFGRVTGSSTQSTSAAHLALKYAPWAQVVSSLRLPRSPKYDLLLRMAQRMAQVARRDGKPVLEEGPTPRARLLFGNFLPMNQSDVVQMVSQALGANGGHASISRQTGIALLVAAGVPIDDARAELERIVAEDTSGAVQVADALAGAHGATEVVAERLGVGGQVSAPPPGTPPKITLSGHEAT